MDYSRKERNVTYYSDACKMYLRHDFAHTCAYCGTIEEAHYINPLVADGGFQKDHFYPQHGINIPSLHSSELHAYSNLFYSCSKCNNLKDNVLLPLNPCQDSIYSGESPYIRVRSEDGSFLMESDLPEGKEFITLLDLNSRHHIELRKEQNKWRNVMAASFETMKAIRESGEFPPDAIDALEETLNLKQPDKFLSICGGSKYGLSISDICHYLHDKGYSPSLVFEEHELDIQLTIEGTTYRAKMSPMRGASYCKVKPSVLKEWQKRNLPCGILRFEETPISVRFYIIDFDKVPWGAAEYRLDQFCNL